ncbi:hypothetical protein [Paraburkholderia hiiakae]|uniref:hypothetical protein n=1 Tax=Paraburkholderia hiiakae TaxID=1081782 RepID=UPI001917E61B|nr:hypothetical protein [Paraburkholderia hiiakae]
MTLHAFDFSETPIVEMWLTRRLPFDTKTVEEKGVCARLKAAIKRMPNNESKILSGVYTSRQAGRFDIENVLAYNVGMSAFAQAGQNGMRFQRVWAAPSASPSGEQFEHHHAYELVLPPQRPMNGASLEVQLTTLDDVARVWWAVSGTSAVSISSDVKLPIAGRFAMHVEVGMFEKKAAS